MIPRETIDRIMEAAVIEEVVGQFVTLKKSGSSYKGLSPFTNEKTPSFFVVPHKGIFKCFSSGKGGNVVNFLMEHEKFSYPEALRWLADKYNIEIEEQELTEEQKQAQTNRESLGIVTRFASDYFQNQLWETDHGKAIALSYLRERGFRDEIIRKFGLGYCPNEWDSFTKAALEAGYEMKYLVESGLTKEKEDKHFDFFRDRIMFPIRNLSGNPIAFGGRIMRTDKKVAKYYNSPESELYNKSRVLYGIDLAKGAMVKEDMCYLVEGYTDVIALHQNEVENVVASAGTSLTEDQIRLIKRYTQNVSLLFDGDAAGIRASFRGIDMLLKQGLNVRVVPFPEGEDPDSYAKKTPSGEFIAYLKEKAVDFLVFKTQLLSKDAAHDPIRKAELIGDIVDSISVIPDAIKRSVYIKECAGLLDVPEQTLISETNKRFRRQFKKETGYAPIVDMPPEPQPQVPTSKKVSVSFQEKDFVRLLLSYGNHSITVDVQGDEGIIEEEISVGEFLIHVLDEDQLELENEKYQIIIDDFRDHLIDERPISDTHFTMHPNLEISQLAADILGDQYQLSPNWQKHRIYPETEEMLLKKAVTDCIHRLKLVKVKSMIREINDEIKTLHTEHSQSGEDANREEQEEKLMQLLDRRRKLDKAKAELSGYSGTVIVE